MPAVQAAPEDEHTLQRLEGAVRLAVGELRAFTGFDGFVLDMPAGADRPPHLIVVGTAEEIAWLLAQRAARRDAAAAAVPPDRDRH